MRTELNKALDKEGGNEEDADAPEESHDEGPNVEPTNGPEEGPSNRRAKFGEGREDEGMQPWAGGLFLPESLEAAGDC